MNICEQTIEELCNLINYLDDSGCLLEEDQETYYSIMNRYYNEKQDVSDSIVHREYSIDHFYNEELGGIE